MATPLFWIALLTLGAMGASAWFRRKRYLAVRTRKGPVPGYSCTDGAEVALRSTEFEPHENWDVVRLEEFHSPRRSRLVLTLHFANMANRGDLVHHIAVELQSRSHANVILVQCLDQARTDFVHLYAPDGRGWSGDDPTQVLSYP